jgi:hypothetical protein
MFLPRLNEQQKLEAYLKHLSDNPHWKTDIERIMNEKGITYLEAAMIAVVEYKDRLICPKCERGTLRHGYSQITGKNYGRCEKCGDSVSTTVDEYLTNQYYKS